MENIKKIIILIFLYNLSTIFGQCNDYNVILNQFLRIKSKEFFRKDSNGKLHYNELLEYKKNEEIYIKYQTQLSNDTSNNESTLKLYLFIGYSAYHNKNAAIMEAFNTDLFPIFKSNKLKFYKILNNLPFLIPSTCYYLNSYFGFEDKNAKLKELFIKDIKKEVYTLLNKENAQTFMQVFQ